MTDRIKGLTVILDKDIRVDDIKPLVDAIKMLKGVMSVDLRINTSDDYMNRIRISGDLKARIYKFVDSLGNY